MLISHQQPYVLPAFVDGQFKPMGTDRPQGRHLSEIIKVMKVHAGDKVDGIVGEQEWMRAQVGFLWEAAIEWAWKEYQGLTRGVDRSLRLEADSIHMTPDGFNADDGMLEEYKFTWKSMRRWDEDAESEFWSWMVQVKAYMRNLPKDRRTNRCRFLVFWAGGDYSRKQGRGPQPTETVFEWTDAELEENWSTVLRYRDYMEKEEAK